MFEVIWSPTWIGGSSKAFLVFNNGVAVQADCLMIEQNIDKHFTENRKQTTIKNFFKL